MSDFLAGCFPLKELRIAKHNQKGTTIEVFKIVVSNSLPKVSKLYLYTLFDVFIAS